MLVSDRVLMQSQRTFTILIGLYNL